MPTPTEREQLTVAGRDVAISNPQKILFPEAGYTKLDLARYYLAVARGALRAAGGRPNVLVRYPNGVGGEFFFQKRAPSSRPSWIEVVSLHFPSGRTAEEVVPRDGAALVWMANLACLELHPHPVRADDLDHPDELRIDLDPVPGIDWSQVRSVARVVQAALADLGLAGWPKTSGSRGIHVYVRIERRWTFDEVRRAALALARDVEQRAPARVQPSRRRVSKHPLIEIARSSKKEDALAGLERWKSRHRDAATHLAPADVLVDAMRGRFHTWTRIRVNLQHVPADLRPPQEPLDPDETPDDWSGVSADGPPRRRPSRARKAS